MIGCQSKPYLLNITSANMIVVNRVNFKVKSELRRKTMVSKKYSSIIYVHSVMKCIKNLTNCHFVPTSLYTRVYCTSGLDVRKGDCAQILHAVSYLVHKEGD